MNSSARFPHEYRLPVSQENIRSIKDPHLQDIAVIHALVRVRDFPNGDIPDKINPRSHEKIDMRSKVPQAIEESLTETPELFHLLNRGCLILAKRVWYDNKSRLLHFIVESADDHGMVDGATTDRVLAYLKRQVSNADFASLKEDEIPEHFKKAYIHLEIIAGEMDQDLRIKLADARNTSKQVKEFALQDLGGNFDWLKDILESSEFRGKIRYRENDPKPVDIRSILALLTLFHPQWSKDNKDPIIAYTGKGSVLDLYTDTEWNEGYRMLAPVSLDILRLYEYLHIEFQKAYKKAYGADGARAKLGKRKEVRYIDVNKPGKAKVLPLTGEKTHYVLTDGWLYPLLASLRVLLDWPNTGKGSVKWAVNPFDFFEKHGADLVYFLVERSEELGRNPNATGKSKGVWLGLRNQVENWLLRERLSQRGQA
ncbi:MAG: hypothetical protein Kow0099_11240 [Candidatus Abyssubacteria bacterium]